MSAQRFEMNTPFPYTCRRLSASCCSNWFLPRLIVAGFGSHLIKHERHLWGRSPRRTDDAVAKQPAFDCPAPLQFRRQLSARRHSPCTLGISGWAPTSPASLSPSRQADVDFRDKVPNYKKKRRCYPHQRHPSSQNPPRNHFLHPEL